MDFDMAPVDIDNVGNCGVIIFTSNNPLVPNVYEFHEQFLIFQNSVTHLISVMKHSVKSCLILNS